MNNLMGACFRLLLLSLFILGILTAGSVAQDGYRPSTLVIQGLDSPAGAGSGEPNLYVSADGSVCGAGMSGKLLLH